jgi:hypothetical protein
MTTRVGVGAAGAVLGVFGMYLLLGEGLDNLVATAVWLVGGLVLHDGVLACVTIAAVSVGLRVVPHRLAGPAAAVFLVLGTVTVTAVPVLGRFGARSDNPTLLDRNYLVGWLLLAGLVCAAAAAMVLVRARWTRSPHAGG